MGLIPAHAGSTRCLTTAASASRAHPRSRGEHHSAPAKRDAASGSSPLTRGARPALTMSRFLSGLIPAHAGSTTIKHLIENTDEAHPRSRGEHAACEKAGVEPTGSSPLTRGAPPRRSLRCQCHRLIPAHAGSTRHRHRRARRTRAHPRSRGEHRAIEEWQRATNGSSPLTRGARVCTSRGHCWRGLIPAHAGSTDAHAEVAVGGGAHPRSRGEHRFGFVRKSPSWGSSPLTRGAHDLRGPARRRQGLIPAHAGSTWLAGRRGASGRAHPRSRGEHTTACPTRCT